MIRNLTCIYFSATDTTSGYVKALSKCLNFPIHTNINLADDKDIILRDFTSEDLLIIASPVYGGRLPKLVAERFKKLRGNETKAIALAVYGNRDYDDALLELTDILTENGFSIIGAAAVIGQHSIFPKVATSRPDSADLQKINLFAEQCKKIIEKGYVGELKIKGNRPYKKISEVKLVPTLDKNLCNQCGKCAKACPVEAINPTDVNQTDNSLCMSCGRCIHICPNNARNHTGLKYKMIGTAFTAAFSRRKEPEFYLPNSESQPVVFLHK